MQVYVLVTTAAYDHGICGVYSSEELARARAEELWNQSDAHHVFRIEVLEVDAELPVPVELAIEWRDAAMRAKLRERYLEHRRADLRSMDARQPYLFFGSRELEQ